jgi:flagellar basal-body rod protein FlgB
MNVNAPSKNVFAIAESRLDWTTQRQAVLAQNIANLNTPSFTPHDVQTFDSYLSSLQKPTSALNQKPKQDRNVAERSIDGNAVSLDDQLVKVADTDSANQLAMNIYKKYTTLFKTALGNV